ncbi:sensor histidine kinase [Amycolatopsis jiangsuensis]|uniref:Two-component system sensor histidine kinase DesK n=1 Tax=Amycolatopsis jiangsuensis TaxID=1181879 RepID=A0A840J622_9PSEU|nr:histidine kinase [Amycolatopsis jiangsuensis]MBB4689233.1 two-component system sensor histidine kinase DesK [Amycolatopsis jiangsuensis]
MPDEDEVRAQRRPGGSTPRWAQGWRRLALASGMLIYPVVAAVAVAQHARRPQDEALGLLIVACFCVCYVLAAIAATQLAWRRFRWLQAGTAALFLAALPFAQAEAFFLGAVVVAVATYFRGKRALPYAAVATVAAVVVPWAVRPWHSDPGWLEGIMMASTVLIVYAFSETVRANGALLEARAEVARLASVSERTRIARDLHDLLGHSLTAIAIKTDLAHRIAAKEESGAVAEIAEIGKLSRQALTDVRAAVSGYRDVTLTTELARGKELLRASGIAADLPTASEVLDTAQQELFGWAVREGLTNVVRHAHASRCTVVLSSSAVEVVDDGGGIGAPEPGNGLAMLRERVALAGGTVHAGPTGNGWRLRVSLERKAATPA